MTVRLPTADHYAAAIDEEHHWLPVLAPPVPVEIPVCLAKGRPGDGFPYNWSVRNWITGDTADHAHIPEEAEFATQVGEFLRALQRVDLSATWTGRPVWFHGDVATGNLLVRNGRLVAVIDFGNVRRRRSRL